MDAIELLRRLSLPLLTTQRKVNLLVRLLNLLSLEEPLHGGFVVDQLALERGGLGFEDRHVFQLLQELVLVDDFEGTGGLIGARIKCKRVI